MQFGNARRGLTLGLGGLLLFGLIFSLAGRAHAQIIDDQPYDLDFTKPESLQGRLEYSDHDKLTLSAKGLGWDTGETRPSPSSGLLPHAWFQTTEPIALGLAWTPTAA